LQPSNIDCRAIDAWHRSTYTFGGDGKAPNLLDQKIPAAVTKL